MVHHPSIFANVKSTGLPRGYEGFSWDVFEDSQDVTPHSYADLEDKLSGTMCGVNCDPVLAQYYMSAIDRVDVTIQYYGAQAGDPARDHRVEHWRESSRLYPRGEVRVTQSDAVGWTDLKAAKQGFKCLFGRDVAIEFAVTYMPLYDDGVSEPRTAVVRRVLTPEDLEVAEDFVAAGLALVDQDAYTEFLYQRWDYFFIAEDLA